VKTELLSPYPPHTHSHGDPHTHGRPGNHTITRISIQTTGLAFDGTGLCSYHVRGVDGSCAKHLESYTVAMLLTVIGLLIIISIPSPHHSFIPGLKPSFFANPSHRSLPFLLQD